MKSRDLMLAFLLSMLALSVVQADEALIYQVDGEANTLFLVGSIHLLRPEDFPLPPGLDDAYEDADALIMEIDLDDLDPVREGAVIRELAMAPDDSSLSDLMGEANWEDALGLADQAGIDLRRMNRVRPWFAAITAMQLKLNELGYQSDFGIEGYFLARALEDGKPITGLETVEQQLGFFAAMDNEAQVEFLLMSLEEIGALTSELEVLIGKWKSGDAAGLYDFLLLSFEDFPELFETLVEVRNRNWMDALTDALDSGQHNYMVIVGALHLLGPTGVVELLREKGYTVTRK